MTTLAKHEIVERAQYVTGFLAITAMFVAWGAAAVLASF